MSIGFMVVGAIIFAVYVWITFWIIFSQNKKQRQENYPSKVDVMDMDGMGNFGRFPKDKKKKKFYGVRNRL